MQDSKARCPHLISNSSQTMLFPEEKGIQRQCYFRMKSNFCQAQKSKVLTFDSSSFIVLKISEKVLMVVRTGGPYFLIKMYEFQHLGCLI